MLLRRTNLLLLIALAVVGLFAMQPNPVWGQAAGVVIDTEGIFQLRYFERSGALNQQKLEAARAQLDPQLARPSKLRKVSLRRLENQLAKRIESGAGFDDEMRYLAGLTRIQYVFYYPETQDIVIAGPAEGFGHDLSGRVVGLTSGHAVLQLEDLIVALRSFGPGGNSPKSIGCSIDPTQEGLAKMQQFLVNISGRIRPSDDQMVARGLRDSLGLQTVTVSGIPADTHMAQVLVEADYRMKLIGIGLENPPVKITSFVQRANPSSVARNALQRWYFVPDYESVRISLDGNAIELVGEGVKLIGEDERVAADGSRVTTSAHADPASRAFTESFTKQYAELAREEPVYGQLRNTIDLLIAAAYIQEQDFYGKAGWSMPVLGSEQAIPVQTYQVPKQVPSAVNVVWKGNTLMTPIGGGVQILPKRALQDDHVQVDDAGKLDQTREQLAPTQLNDDQWWWD